MQQTTNFKLNLPEGSDLFAPMHDYNPNWSAIDNQMQLNRLNSMQEADCIFAGGVFQLTRKVKGSTFFRFTAPADYTAGNTFTVDGEVFTAGLAGNFAALPDGAFTNGNIVVAYLDAGDAKKLALMTGSSPLPMDIDAKTLEGHGADYFATVEALNSVDALATSAGNDARRAKIITLDVWTNETPDQPFNAQQISNLKLPANYTRGALLVEVFLRTQKEVVDKIDTANPAGVYNPNNGGQNTFVPMIRKTLDGALAVYNRPFRIHQVGNNVNLVFGDAFGTVLKTGEMNSATVGVNNAYAIPTKVRVYITPDN